MKLNSLNKHKVFDPIVKISNNVKLVGYKHVFVRKCNERNEIQHYKAKLVAQCFFVET